MHSRKTPSRFRARLGAVLAGIAFVSAAGAAVLSTLGPTAASSGASPSAAIALLAIDGDPTGNSARSVGTIERCVSANVGEPAQIDIVVPAPGVPAARGMGAYQFSILYDPAVIWIGTDDSAMLLAQAAGSNVIPIADPRPDRNGVYESWGVDFGPSGIEPAGSSETGPGVIARITLLLQSEGVSTLTLSDVLVIDDASERISLESVQSATINVGQSCLSESVTPLTPAPSLSAFPKSGGPPAPNAGGYSLLIVAGLLAVLGCLALLIANLSANSSNNRRH